MTILLGRLIFLFDPNNRSRLSIFIIIMALEKNDKVSATDTEISPLEEKLREDTDTPLELEKEEMRLIAKDVVDKKIKEKEKEWRDIKKITVSVFVIATITLIGVIVAFIMGFAAIVVNSASRKDDLSNCNTRITEQQIKINNLENSLKNLKINHPWLKIPEF